MTAAPPDLTARIAAELRSPAPAEVLALAARLADPGADAAVLYYGSTLRTGDLDGVLDFYRLTRRPHRKGLRGVVEAVLWPEVSYHEVDVGGRVLRVKVATLPLQVFRKAAEGRTLDTTIWARFVQPAQCVWRADDAAFAAAAAACAAAVVTASRYAAALGPEEGPPEAYWRALFRRTYAAEFRIEPGDRADSLTAADPQRYAELLPLAWAEGGVAFARDDSGLRPARAGLPRWWAPSVAAKPLNVARLAKAALTFEGAARYAAWKVQRHTGIALPVSAFAERHPLLAAPGAWLTLRRRQAEARRARLSSPNS